jgi:hypothetical protein
MIESQSSVSSYEIKRVYGNRYLNSIGRKGVIPRRKMNSRLRRIPLWARYAVGFGYR